MRLKRQTGFLPLLRCPYCHRRSTEGLIAYDLDVLAAALASRADTPTAGHVVRHWDQPRLIYDPDGVRNAPCAHLIAHLFDVAVFRHRAGAREIGVELFESYDHPWFGQKGDPTNDHLHEFLWWTANDGIRTAFDPVSPSMVRRSGHRSMLSRSGWMYRICGAGIYALDAHDFLAQLGEGFERRDELECR